VQCCLNKEDQHLLQGETWIWLVGFVETLLIRMVLDLLVSEGGRPQAYWVGVVGCGRVLHILYLFVGYS